MSNSKKQTKNEECRAARQKDKNTKNTKLFASIVAIAVLGFSGYWFFAKKQNQEINAYTAQISEKLGQDIVIEKETKYSIQSRQHISTNQAHVPYSTNPPTSGPHSERNDNDEDGVVLAAWGKMLKLRQFNDVIAEDFIKRNFNKSPEQLAR